MMQPTSYVIAEICMQFQFNNLLLDGDIDPKDVLVLRHRPKQPKLRKVLPWLAEENPKVFNAYQQTQKPKAEKAMQQAKSVASFIGHESGKAVFVGLYKVNGYESLSFDQYRKEPTLSELTEKYEMEGMTDEHDKTLWFDLVLLEFYSKWKGKLIIRWPGGERCWYRWADRKKNEFEILAITEDSILVSEMPEWNQLILTWSELKYLPEKWRDKLSQWRGIYFIIDVSDGKGYVGAAYGHDNLLGRWLNYAKSGHGDNKQLRNRNPENFRFSILQRVSPDIEPSEVQFIEKTWKDRLHTREREVGLNDN